MTITMRLGALCAMLLLAAKACVAGLPEGYGALSFERALAQSQRDGKPVMVVFGEDW